jgi:hypothetical protein
MIFAETSQISFVCTGLSQSLFNQASQSPESGQLSEAVVKTIALSIFKLFKTV